MNGFTQKRKSVTRFRPSKIIIVSLLNIRCNHCAFAFESNSIRNYQTLLIIDRDQITITEKLPSIIVTFKLTIGTFVRCHLAQFIVRILNNDASRKFERAR